MMSPLAPQDPDARRVPRGLKAAVFAALAVVAALLCWDLFWLHPGYAFGDEATQMSLLQDALNGAPMAWGWAQGSLHRLLLFAWMRAGGARLGWIHGPGLLFLGIELALLFRLTRRWVGEEAAWWSVLVGLIATGTWLRTRSLLSFQLLPLLALGMGLWAGRVRGRWQALAWGLLAGSLGLDYEGVIIAMPLLYLACLGLEEDFRRQARWSAAGGVLSLLAIFALQRSTVADYAQLRSGVSLGVDASVWARRVALNLWEVLSGGSPKPYLGVSDWPAIPFWIWPALGLGFWQARRSRFGLVALWALVAILATQASLAPYGVPVHRLAAAWPALCMVAASGFVLLRRQSGRAWPAWALGLAFLSVLELHGYALHLLRNASSALDGSVALQRAADEAGRIVRDEGGGVSTALLDWRFPLSDFHLNAAHCPRRLGEGEAPLAVLLPADLRVAAEAVTGTVKVYRLSRAQQPVILLRVQGAEARRFRAIDAAVAQGRPPALRDFQAMHRSIVAWLGAHPQADIWAWSNLLRTEAWLGFARADSSGREAWQFYRARPVDDPAVPSILAAYFSLRSPDVALRLCQDALQLDPLYTPAYDQAEAALKRLGRLDEARVIHRQWEELYAQGAWFIAD